jgi:hypothetical protein
MREMVRDECGEVSAVRVEREAQLRQDRLFSLTFFPVSVPEHSEHVQTLAFCVSGSHIYMIPDMSHSRAGCGPSSQRPR